MSRNYSTIVLHSFYTSVPLWIKYDSKAYWTFLTATIPNTLNCGIWPRNCTLLHCRWAFRGSPLTSFMRDGRNPKINCGWAELTPHFCLLPLLRSIRILPLAFQQLLLKVSWWNPELTDINRSFATDWGLVYTTELHQHKAAYINLML